jgi:RNA polymerase sigma factor (sigma-70 family)
MGWAMMEAGLNPLHNQPSGLCEDVAGEASALIRRMAGGDGAALVELHGAWAPVLLGIASRMLGDRREADDVLRLSFERMWKRAGSYDPHQAPPFVWAFMLMRELVLSRLRQKRTGKQDAPRETASGAGERCDNPKVLTGDDCRRLRAAMEQLDLEERTCLELAVFLGCARPHVPSATVKNHLRKALETLRNQLSRHEL